MASTVSAASKVLGTYELLEHVLSYVALNDLLTGKAVTKSWKDIIERSAAIQRTLFLAPAPVTKMLLWEKTSDFEPRPTVIDSTSNGNWVGAWSPPFPIVKLHPMLKTNTGIGYGPKASTEFTWDWKRLALLPPESWVQDTLVSQPPTNKIIFEGKVTYKSANEWEVKPKEFHLTTCEDANGVKLRAITSQLRAALATDLEAPQVSSVPDWDDSPPVKDSESDKQEYHRRRVEAAVGRLDIYGVQGVITRCVVDTNPWLVMAVAKGGEGGDNARAL